MIERGVVVAGGMVLYILVQEVRHQEATETFP
jgi:hypothetical protein